jgi:AraC family transcriptional regulator
VRQILERLAAEVLAPGFASDLLVEGLGLTLLAETGRRLETRAETLSRTGGLPLWRIKRIEERIRDGDGPVTTGELAQLCGLSRRQLSRAFREETGRTITAFAQELTMDRAKRLLADSSTPIAAIARQVGFATPAAFAYAFRRQTGLSPRDFRATSPTIVPPRLR